jgi:hypothetical protein
MKNFLRMLLAGICTVVLISGCTQKPPQEGIHSCAELKSLFSDPPSEYRSAPLWDWNDEITEEGIAFRWSNLKSRHWRGVRSSAPGFDHGVPVG